MSERVARDAARSSNDWHLSVDAADRLSDLEPDPPTVSFWTHFCEPIVYRVVAHSEPEGLAIKGLLEESAPPVDENEKPARPNLRLVMTMPRTKTGFAMVKRP